MTQEPKRTLDYETPPTRRRGLIVVTGIRCLVACAALEMALYGRRSRVVVVPPRSSATQSVVRSFEIEGGYVTVTPLSERKLLEKIDQHPDSPTRKTEWYQRWGATHSTTQPATKP